MTPRTASRPLALALFATALAPASRAQGLLYTWPLESSASRAVAAGDLDGDGVGDFAVGTPYAGAASEGRLLAFSGADGRELFRVDGPAATQYLGYDVAALGDVDGDGRDDLAVGAPFGGLALPGFVRAVSGAGGATLWQVDAATGADWLGARLASPGDVDGDGVADLAVTEAPSPTGAKVRVLSGASGAQLYELAQSAGAGELFGAALDAAGDFDGDGVGDLAVGDPYAPNLGGRVSVHSGVDGALLASFEQPTGVAGFGESLAGVGDVDGDGVPDLLVGSPGETITPQVTWGRARLLSGATGALLLLLEGGGDLTSYANGVARYPDLDGDGADDLALSAGFHHLGCCTFFAADLRVHSSGTGALLYSAPGQAVANFAVVPDAGGDARPDFLLPAYGQGLALSIPGLTPPDPAFPFLACPAAPTSGGCEASLVTDGAPSATEGEPLTLVARGLPAGAAGLFAWSVSSTSVPFGAGTLCLAAPVRRSPVFTAGPGGPTCVGQPTGAMRWRMPDAELLALGIQPGERFYLQAWFRDPGVAPPDDSGLTNGVALTLWP